MTYAVGNVIVASDFQTFRGSIGPASPYPDNPSATNKVAALIGTGYGTRGYGQSTTLNGVATSDPVTAVQWNNLRNSMNAINIHTGSGLSLQSNVSVGGTIQALNGTLGRPNIPVLISSLDTNRMNFNVGQMTVSSVLTSTRSTTWFTQVYHEFTATFSSENQARYFFNTGSQVYLAASRTGGSASSLNTQMTQMLTDMGTIRVGAQSTTYTGFGGTTYPIGYYGLTGTYQTLFYHVGSYSGISYTVQARAEGITGTNGGNGNVIRFQAIFATGLPSYDTLDGILTSSISQLLAGGVLTVSAPTYLTTVAL